MTVTTPFRIGLVFFVIVACAILTPAVLAQNPAAANTPSPTANPAPSLENAQHLYRTGKLDAAIQEYTQLETSPQPALAYTGLTRAYLKKKDPTNAYAAAAKAIELAPNMADAKVARGEAYFRQGKIPEAEADFVTVINSGAENARAYLGLARVSQTISLYHREKQMIDKARSLDPKDPDITRMWMGTLTTSERIQALRDYLAQETDDDSEARTNLEQQLDYLQKLPPNPVQRCRIVSKINETTIALEQLLENPTHLRGYGLTVKFNGAPARLMLDTGAPGILIDRKLAEKAGVQRVAESSLRGVGDKGAVKGYIGHVDKIQIGDLEFADCDVKVSEQSSVIGNDGLIGAVEFSRFLVELDMPNQKMHLSQLPLRPNETATEAGLESEVDRSSAARFSDRYIAPEMQSYTRIFRISHMLLIPTTLSDTVSKLFLIDTGSLFNIISPDAAREVTRVSADSRVHVKGVSGNVEKVFSSDDLTMKFANIQQRNLDVISVDTTNISNNAGTEVSGTLGFAMLRLLDIKIDYRDGLISFAYKRP
jgi:tetratricopeptide (TPR) repeat protein